MRRPAPATLAAILLALLPAILLAALVPDVGRVPRSDYWGAMLRLEAKGAFAGDLASAAQTLWSFRLGEHRIALPATLWWLNVYATEGDNRALAGIALGLLLLIGALLLRRLPHLGRPALAVAVAWWLWSPARAETLGLAFAGIHYYLASLFALALLDRATTPVGDGRHAWLQHPALWPVLGLCATLSFGSSLAVVPAFVLALALGRASRVRWAWGGMTLAALIVPYFAIVYVLKAAIERRDGIGGTVRYVTHFFGLGEGRATLALLGVGAIAALSAGIVVWRRLRAHGRRVQLSSATVFWLATAVYAIGCAVLAAVARAGKLGVEQAHAQRYGFFVALLWAALAALLISGLAARGPRPAQIAALATAVLAIAAGLTQLEQLDIQRAVGRHQAAAEVALRRGHWDDRLLNNTTTRWPPRLIRFEPTARRLGHVPFDWLTEPWPAQTIPRDRWSSEAVPRLVVSMASETHDPTVVRLGGKIPKSVEVAEIVALTTSGELRSDVVWWRQPGGPVRWDAWVRTDRAVSWPPRVRLEGEDVYRPLPLRRGALTVLAEAGLVEPAEGRLAVRSRTKSR
ncbi:MAG: hypothetical protein AAGN46_15310 [Acidobacteriota bacterium]